LKKLSGKSESQNTLEKAFRKNQKTKVHLKKLSGKIRKSKYT
jgi:hypothetical protein